MATTVPTAAAFSSRFGRGPLTFSIFLGFVSAILLDFCFPVAGPMPPWRAGLAWIALVPLLFALLSEGNAAYPRYLRRAALIGYLSGILWYVLNCYWIYQTMLLYGNIPPIGSAGIVLLYSLVLGLYFGLFGLLLALFRRRFGLVPALVLAPFLWAAVELAAARITSVPWDQLGYSQVDNLWLTRLAPFTGVYGISFVIVAVDALLAAALLASKPRLRSAAAFAALLVAAGLQCGSFVSEPPSPTQATAVLLQDDLSVTQDNSWVGQVWDSQTHRLVPLWDRNVDRFLRASEDACTPYYPGLPQTRLPLATPPCKSPAPITIIAWPEAPSPFRGWDPRFAATMAALTHATHATAVAGNISADEIPNPDGRSEVAEYNSASVFAPDGRLVGRYDKIHLVPFGEYVPYREVFFFARHLTQQVGDFNRGTRRRVFSTGDDHRFGVFICYEAVFGDEVRHFAKNGAQFLVNISDDGWYGDTSAPWQHLNMARMRAIENRRWLLRDTNSGVTAAIDPHGRVTQSAPRHVFTSLAVRYGYRNDVTFYSRYGDVFAYLCCAVMLAALALCLLRRAQAPEH